MSTLGLKKPKHSSLHKKEVKGDDDVLMSPTSVIKDDTRGKKKMFLWANTFIFCAKVFYCTILCPLNLCDNTKDIGRESTYK